MKYHAVGNRCAVDFSEFRLLISAEQSLEILQKKGFSKIDVDVVLLARSFMGIAEYRRSARLQEAPGIFDCSSFVKWLYGQKGIWLPRRSVQQREFGSLVNFCDIKAGDVVFVSGLIDYYVSDPFDGVGHVGIATESGTVIHAASRKAGIIESPYSDFVKKGLRGIRRMVTDKRTFYTFETPIEREVECSDDIYWIILQNLP